MPAHLVRNLLTELLGQRVPADLELPWLARRLKAAHAPGAILGVPDDAAGVLARLMEAKRESDRRNYRRKHEILRCLLAEDPTAFSVDSVRPGGIVGLTHRTGFRIHAPSYILSGTPVAPAPVSG